MAKKRIFDLPQTKGEFQIRGNASGVLKNNFFTTKKTKNNADMNLCNFGVKFDEGQTAYLTLNGTVNKSVYYYNSKEKKTQEVAWANRNNAPGEDYKLIGVNVGLVVTEDGDGNKVNDKKMLTDYDAAKYVSTHLKDDMPIFTRGTFEFSSYIDKNGDVKRGHKLIPNQISLCSKNIDFDADDFKSLADFKTTIVFESIDKEKNDKGNETGRFVVSALHIGYSTITNVTFIVEDSKLAGQMKKGLKAYNAIEVTGKFQSNMVTETVEEEDDWGQKSSFDKTNNPIVFEFVITGAKPSTIDRETYTEDNIADARKAIANKDKVEENYGDKKETAADDDAWGDTSADDGDEPW
jgi:hypothetical protein